MLKETGYHGSERIRGEKVLREKRWPITRGEHHWLGDGVYFYTEAFYSYKWIVDMYKHRYKNEANYDDLLRHYLILKADIHAETERVFDLTKAEYKILFDYTLKQLKEKAKVPDDRMPEGVVLNYMFKKLGYAKKYDLVKALFTSNRNKYTFENRLGYMPQEQLCIKNPEVVNNINEYHFKDYIDHFEFLIHNMYYDNIREEQTSYSYSQQRYKYNKETNDGHS